MIELQKLGRVQHKYILWVTELIHSWEIWAADNGYRLPPPKFPTLTEWRENGQE